MLSLYDSGLGGDSDHYSVFCGGVEVWTDDDADDGELRWSKKVKKGIEAVAARVRQQCATSLIMRWADCLPHSSERLILRECILDLWKGQGMGNDGALKDAEHFMYWMEHEYKADGSMPPPCALTICNFLKRWVFTKTHCIRFDEKFRHFGCAIGRPERSHVDHSYRDFVMLYVNLRSLKDPDYTKLLMTTRETEARQVPVHKSVLGIHNNPNTDQVEGFTFKDKYGAVLAYRWCGDCFGYVVAHHVCPRYPAVTVTPEGMLERVPRRPEGIAYSYADMVSGGSQ